MPPDISFINEDEWKQGNIYGISENRYSRYRFAREVKFRPNFRLSNSDTFRF